MVVIQQTKLVQSFDRKFHSSGEPTNSNGIDEQKLSFVMNVENDVGCEFYLSADNTLIRLEDGPQIDPILVECAAISERLQQLQQICPASYSIYALEYSEFTYRQKQLQLNKAIN